MFISVMKSLTVRPAVALILWMTVVDESLAVT